MVVLDASALIALLDVDDAHHASITARLDGQLHARWLISSLTLAEVMVRATADPDLMAELGEEIADLQIEVVPLLDTDTESLAALRGHTRLKMPDCCVALVAQNAGAAIVTTDETLRERAREIGIRVLPD